MLHPAVDGAADALLVQPVLDALLDARQKLLMGGGAGGQLVGNLPRRDHIGTGRTHVTCTHYCNFAHDSVCFLSNTLDNR